MIEVSTTSLREYFNSVNGGISMCLARFSDSLVEHGLNEFYRFANEVSNHSSESAMRNDWHFLRVGVEGVGNEGLESAIASLAEPFARIVRLGEEYQRYVVSVEKAEKQWQAAAERAKQELAVWEPWAVETEIEWRKRSFPWVCISGNDLSFRLQVSFALCGAIAELESPQRMQKNLPFFEARIKAIRATISRAYLDGGLPDESSVDGLDMALNDLMKHQIQVNKLVDRKAEIAEEFESAREAYCTQRGQLTILLSKVPDEAQWALFRICRPDLCKPPQYRGTRNSITY